MRKVGDRTPALQKYAPSCLLHGRLNNQHYTYFMRGGAVFLKQAPFLKNWHPLLKKMASSLVNTDTLAFPPFELFLTV